SVHNSHDPDMAWPAEDAECRVGLVVDAKGGRMHLCIRGRVVGEIPITAGQRYMCVFSCRRLVPGKGSNLKRVLRTPRQSPSVVCRSLPKADLTDGDGPYPYTLK
ncbi:hypothetical protein KIPB_003806, partial [Kipferlia bialata]